MKMPCGRRNRMGHTLAVDGAKKARSIDGPPRNFTSECTNPGASKHREDADMLPGSIHPIGLSLQPNLCELHGYLRSVPAEFLGSSG